MRFSESEAAALERQYGPAKPLPVNAPKAAPAASGDECSPLLFLAACKLHGLPEPLPEYQFSERRWRFDYCFRLPLKGSRGVAIEIQGGLFSNGRHVRGKALLKEYEKLNAAQLAGYTVLLVSPQQVKSGEVFALVRNALKGEK